MFKSLKGSLIRRLTALEQQGLSKDSLEIGIREFIEGILGPDSFRFIHAISSSPEGDIIISTTSKAFAAELTVRKDALLEYLKEKKVSITSLRIQ